MDDLTVDPWHVPNDERPYRALGQAMNVSISLLEASRISGCRLISFIAGPCTMGEGQVVDIKLENTIRTFYDI